MRLLDLVARSGGTCWLCGEQVDLDGPRTAPAAPTVDHVVPRAEGGTSDPVNLRLAHRRCNGARGSRIPELTWPGDVPVLDAAPLWPVVRRALRRPGEWEVVAVLPDEETTARARAWLAAAVAAVLGGPWEVRTTAVTATAATLSLRLAGEVERAPAPRRRRRRGRGQ